MKHFIIFIDIRKKEVAKTLEFKKKVRSSFMHADRKYEDR